MRSQTMYDQSQREQTQPNSSSSAHCWYYWAAIWCLICTYLWIVIIGVWRSKTKQKFIFMNACNCSHTQSDLIRFQLHLREAFFLSPNGSLNHIPWICLSVNTCFLKFVLRCHSVMLNVMLNRSSERSCSQAASRQLF